MLSCSSSSSNTGGGSCGGNNSHSKHRLLHIIEPEKCIIEDLEILAFENTDQLNYYTVWHEALFDKRRERNAESERERQIIRNEITRKTCQLIGSAENVDDLQIDNKKSNSRLSSKSSRKNSTISSPVRSPKRSISKIVSSPTRQPIPSTSSSLLSIPQETSDFYDSNSRSIVAFKFSKAKHIAHGSQPLPEGLAIHNNGQYVFNTMPDGKKMLRYKLNKMYNKYRGRQMRRNMVIEKQRNSKIEAEVSKSYINPWLAYIALQALKIPEQVPDATPNDKRPTYTYSASDLSKKPPKKTKKSKVDPTFINIPMNQNYVHIVYVPPNNFIPYSNKIEPQQVADYRKKSHVLPSTATSKKSSAASYDVYEIMEVLANTTKTNVTITRNSHRPTGASPNEQSQVNSIYSHSVNSNTPGIVSTQLHHQAKSYLDLMSKFYAEEAQRIQEEEDRLRNEPTIEETVGRYLHV